MEEPFTSLSLDPRSEVSFVGQIRHQVALLIADDRIKVGTRLPAVRTLADHLGVNVNTVRAAYKRLQDEGLVVTRHGVGTTVADPGDRSLGALAPGGYSRNMIGVVIAGLDPFYLPLVAGIEYAAESDGVLVLVFDAQNSDERAQAGIKQLVARAVDGIITV